MSELSEDISNLILLSVDPGQHTAVAVFVEGSYTDTYYITGGFDKQVKQFRQVLQNVINGQLLPFNNPHPNLEITAVIESVQWFEGSAVSTTALQRGNLMTLSYLIGAYNCLCLLEDVNCVLIKPSQWKGQLPKEVIERRVRRALPSLELPNNHCWDAVGLGLTCLGKI